MNYFELFGLPIGFQLDLVKLRSSYMDLQRQFHPDKFTQSSQEEQEDALVKSSQANKGFTLLSKKEDRLSYVLTLKGCLTKDEKYTLSPSFLMEMMDLNEAWMDASNETDKQKVKDQVKTIQNEIYTPVQAILEMDSMDQISQEAMLQVKEYYFKQKYLNRILEDFR